MTPLIINQAPEEERTMNKNEHLLTILNEECAELIQELIITLSQLQQRTSKVLRFSGEEAQPGQGLPNSARLLQEWHDAIALVEMLQEAEVLRIPTSIEARQAIELKKLKVRTFLEHSKECGTLDD
jgi:hypothetical protein